MPKKIVMELIKEEDKPKATYGFSYETVVSDSPEVIDADPEPKRKRGPGRPPKNNSYSNSYIDNQGYSKGKKKSEENQFESGYTTTAKMLFEAVAQTNSLYMNIDEELKSFKNNRAYGGRNRMSHMSEFMNTQATLVNTKINAIRELNSIRNKINDLTLKKMQIDKGTIDENSDKAVMDAYYAMINSSSYGLPQFNSPLLPASINTGVNMSGTSVTSQSIIDNTPMVTSSTPAATTMIPSDPSFEEYKNNMTPIQRKMILDKDPNIKTAVVYNQSTGDKYFDIINVQTGQSVPGVQRPADFLLDTMRIDAANGIAVNSNINKSYPLVIIGDRVADEL